MLLQVLALLPDWLNPDTMLDELGRWALLGTAAIVFAECGLLIGFFLPGDSLLFTVGLFAAKGDIPQPLWLICLVLTICAFVGNVVGYEIGRAAGPKIFSKPDSRIFRQEYVDKTMDFFERYGARAIVLARFVPIVRTFITVTAGVGKMDRRRYLVFSAIGAVLWATGVTLLGYSLGSVDFVHKNLEIIALLIVAISVVPMAIEFLRDRNKRRRAGAEPQPETEAEIGARAAEVVHEAEQH